MERRRFSGAELRAGLGLDVAGEDQPNTFSAHLFHPERSRNAMVWCRARYWLHGMNGGCRQYKFTPMDLYLFGDDERRALCRPQLEALELWLRRLIHETLSATHGAEYLNAADHGGRLIKKEVVDAIARRRAKEPLRYQRPVDAAHLSDLVTIICNRSNWQRYFGAALSQAFPHGSDEAREFLNRLVDPRHKLSHANPISVHEAARVICYTLDVIESLKEYYMRKNLDSEYNTPTIMRVTDSFGNVWTRANHKGAFAINGGRSLWPGQRLSIEIEIDPSFKKSGYNIKWNWTGMHEHEIINNHSIVIDIEERHVHETFQLSCEVNSNKPWHRLGSYDDLLTMIYKVLPPLS